MSCWHQHLTLGDSVAELMLQDTARRLHGACARAPSRIIQRGGGVIACVMNVQGTMNTLIKPSVFESPDRVITK